MTFLGPPSLRKAGEKAADPRSRSMPFSRPDNRAQHNTPPGASTRASVFHASPQKSRIDFRLSHRTQ